MTTTPIVALDVPNQERAMDLVMQLGASCEFYKVGSELFTACGPSIVEVLCNEGKRVFLDLKFHDIPNTVRSAARAGAACGASLLTVHGAGGSAMVRAAVDGAGNDCGVLVVTVLTSMDSAMLAEALGHPGSVSDEVSRLASLAAAAGAHGVVCSGQEAARVSREHDGRLRILVPGVRLAGDAAHDQSRVVTPAAAVQSGASYVVLGRTVTAASDPSNAMARVLSELAGGQRSDT